MKKMVIIVLLGMVSGSQARHLNIKFDAHGNFINPDDYLVYSALEADKKGHKNDAMWQLIDAAEYGNKHAQYFHRFVAFTKRRSGHGFGLVATGR